MSGDIGIESTLRSIAHELGNGARMSSRDAVYLTRAADEIERMREQLRLANIGNFNATAEIDRLREELVRNADEFRETLTELRQRVEKLTAERDEARHEVCAFSFDDPRRTAEDRGWVGLLEPEDHAP